MGRKPSIPPSPTQALAERVVAWHNRHPLAERLSLDQVQSIGVVAMPFVRGNGAGQPETSAASTAPGSGPMAMLRHRLASAARRLRWRRKPQPMAPAWQPVFSEDFLEPLGAEQVRPWAARHAVANRPGDEQWAQRIVLTDARMLPPSPEPAPDESPPPETVEEDNAEVGGVVLRYAASAALVLDHGRRRVLISTGKEVSVLGRRSWSVVRISFLTATLASLATIGVTLPLWRPNAHPSSSPVMVASHAASQAASPAAAHGPDSSPSSPGAASAAASGAPHAPESDLASHAAQPASGPTPEASASTPAMAEAQAAAAAHDQAPGKAATAIAAAGAQHDPPDGAGSLPAPRISLPNHLAGASSSLLPPVVSPAGPAAPRGPVFALVTRNTQTESESRSALSRMAAAAAPLQERLPGTHTEVMRSGGRWAAVWWPFTSRDDASQARWALALKGVTVDLVEF